MTERWKPEDREKFWFIDRDGNANFHMRTEWDSDNDKYDFGNCFQSKEEAEAAAEKVKALLLSLHEQEDVNSQKTSRRLSHRNLGRFGETNSHVKTTECYLQPIGRLRSRMSRLAKW